MKSKGNEEKTPYRSRGSVLDDLGFSASEALEIRVKAELYRDLLTYIRERGLSQQELGTVLGLHQPDVSQFLNGRLSRFSVSKLIKFAGKLNLDAQIRLSKPKPVTLPGVSAARKSYKKEAVAV